MLPDYLRLPPTGILNYLEYIPLLWFHGKSDNSNLREVGCLLCNSTKVISFKNINTGACKVKHEELNISYKHNPINIRCYSEKLMDLKSKLGEKSLYTRMHDIILWQ